MENFQLIVELIGAAAFAISGAALGIQKRMDLLGVAIMGMTTAVGGGMLRDVMLGSVPSALLDPTQALLALVVSLALFALHKSERIHFRIQGTEFLLLLADSLGLGIFTVHGVSVCAKAGMGGHVFLTLLLSVLTGVGGGLLRDVMAGVPPYIFVKHIYALASIAGACAFILLYRAFGEVAALIGASALVVIIRLLAAHYHWNLPRLKIKE